MDELIEVATHQHYYIRTCEDSQLLELEATELLEITDEVEEVRDEEGVEVEAVIDADVWVEDGEGVGEVVVSSSVEMTEVRVELERTVDCAEGEAIWSSALNPNTQNTHSGRFFLVPE